MPGTVLGTREYILPLGTVYVCVLRNREREVVRTCFRGTSLHIAVFSEREVWFGIQIDLDSDPPITKFCAALSVLPYLSQPRFSHQ